MRKEYDLTHGRRGKFFGKVDTTSPIIEPDDSPLDENFDEELAVLESNLDRIKILRPRLVELDTPTRERIAKRISIASEKLEEIALSR